MLYRHSTLILAASLTLGLATQPSPWELKPEDLTVVSQTQATTTARQEQKQTQVALIAPERYDLQNYPITEDFATHWRKTLWATALLEPQKSYIAETFAEILNLTQQPNLSPAQKQTVQMAMQVGTQLYLSNPQFYALIGDRFQQTLLNSPYPEWVAMALSALVQSKMDPAKVQQWITEIRSRFPDGTNLALEIALKDTEEQLNPTPTPPLKDLLNWQITPGQAQLYVVCRSNRAALCRAVLKDNKGQFVRQNGDINSPIWSVLLLSRSLHSLRWNFVRGNTPQGIYRLEGTMPRSSKTEFRAYGQFPLIKVFMPFESGAKYSLPTDLNAYQSLLPPAWQNYFPLEQTYWAGKLGRSLIRIHGSGEPNSFFVNNSRFPQSYGWNPAIGCLSALELYDEEGRLKQADMPKILTTFNQAAGGQIEGYLILVEIPGNSEKAIALEEIYSGSQKSEVRSQK